MHALVTGANGFVGRHLTEHLEGEGDRVTGIDRTDGPDIVDTEAIAAKIASVNPDVIYHLAGQADVAGSWKDPNGTFRANLDGTRNVLDGARALGDHVRVIAVTSADVYGFVTPDELPLDESADLRPTSPYAASKAAADLTALQAFLGYRQPVIRVRAFTHLGPRQSPRFVAAAVAHRIVEAENTEADEITVGNLEARRDFTDVRDVVRAYRSLAADGVPGEAYNVCSGVDHLVADVVDFLRSRAHRPIALVQDPDLMRPSDIPVLRGDCTKLTSATGWRPRFTLEQTLTDLLAEARSAYRRND